MTAPISVKPLVWSEGWAGSNDDIPTWVGKSPFGWQVTIDFAHDPSVQKHADAIERKLAQKQADAQADYQARIRSTISAHPADAAIAAIDEALWLFVKKRLALNGQYEAVDIQREDGIYQIVIEDLKAIRKNYEEEVQDRA